MIFKLTVFILIAEVHNQANAGHRRPQRGERLIKQDEVYYDYSLSLESDEHKLKGPYAYYEEDDYYYDMDDSDTAMVSKNRPAGISADRGSGGRYQARPGRLARPVYLGRPVRITHPSHLRNVHQKRHKTTKRPSPKLPPSKPPLWLIPLPKWKNGTYQNVTNSNVAVFANSSVTPKVARLLEGDDYGEIASIDVTAAIKMASALMGNAISDAVSLLRSKKEN